MKFLLAPNLFVVALTLSGYSSLQSAAGSLLTTPFKWLGSLGKAVTGKVTAADTPAGMAGKKSATDAMAQRGLEIAAGGTYGTPDGTVEADVADSVAHR